MKPRVARAFAMLRLAGCLVGMAMVCLAGTARTGAADSWKLVEQFERVEGFLSDREPEGDLYANWEDYDEATAKFTSMFPLEVEEGHVLMVDVYSFEFQPIVMVLDENVENPVRGTIMDPEFQQGMALYHVRLEYHAPASGKPVLMISSEAPDQGHYAMEWSLWGPDTAAAEPQATPLPPGTSECDCQDPATGRYFQSPFEDLGECIPERAVKWCD